MKIPCTCKLISACILILLLGFLALKPNVARSDSSFMFNTLLKTYRAYFAAIDAGAQMRRLPYDVKKNLSPHYPPELLDRVWYGESRYLVIEDTAMTDCSKIYFPTNANMLDIIEKGNLFEKSFRDDLHWLLHELTHSQQCEALGGRDEYAELWFGELTTTTITQLLTDWRSVNADMLHDVMPMEKAAEQNAVKILSAISSK